MAIDEHHVDGVCMPGGVFLDLGGDWFGSRPGAHGIDTAIKPSLERVVDGAGVPFFLDFRYDFARDCRPRPA